MVTHQSFMALVQRTSDRLVRAENLDPLYSSVSFEISDPEALPHQAERIRGRSEWLLWTQQQKVSNTWEGLLKGTLAFMRTGWLDPSGHRCRSFDRAGLRILISESDLPSGKGMSASSALPAGLGIALNALWEPEQKGSGEPLLSDLDLRQLDHAAYLVGDLGGMADITAILEGHREKATVLWHAPDRIAEQLLFPPELRVFAVDSGVERLDGPETDPWLHSFAQHTKTLGNVTPPLAVLWMRHLSRTVEALRPLEAKLISAGQQVSPYGLLRELTEAGSPRRGDSCLAVGSVEKLLSLIPNDWTLERIQKVLEASLPELQPEIEQLNAELVPLGDQTPSSTTIPMQQMARYGIREINRGISYLHALAAGDISTLIRLSNEAHNGDRALYDPFKKTRQGRPILTPWGQSEPPEAFQRSLPSIDVSVDAFCDFIHRTLGPGKASARISGAGLGGLISIHVRDAHHDTARQWWEDRGHPIVQIDPSEGTSLIQAGQQA